MLSEAFAWCYPLGAGPGGQCGPVDHRAGNQDEEEMEEVWKNNPHCFLHEGTRQDLISG